MHLGELDHWEVPTAEAFRGVLESPVTKVRELTLKSVGNALVAWSAIRPALRANRTLKMLKLLAAVGHTGVVETAADLSNNTSLECFEAYPCSRIVCGNCEHPFSSSTTVTVTGNHTIIGSGHNSSKKKRQEKISKEDCVTARAVEALGSNSTLRRLMVDTCIAHHTKDGESIILSKHSSYKKSIKHP